MKHTDLSTKKVLLVLLALTFAQFALGAAIYIVVGAH
jgi:hypothetical protein